MPDVLESDDGTLARRAREGDLEAFWALAQRYMNQVLSICFNMSGNYDEAYDLAMDSLMKALARISRLENDSLFRFYLYRIASRMCIDRWRRISSWTRKKDLLHLAADQRHSSWMHPQEQAAEVSNVRDALRKLHPKRRMVIILRHYLGLSSGEAADVLGIKAGTERILLCRALEDLRRLLRLTEGRRDA